MADLTFEHTLPDEIYENEGHPFHGENKMFLYAMGMLYSEPEIIQQQFDNVEDYKNFIIQNIALAKEKYSEVLNREAQNYIRGNLNRFLKKIRKAVIEDIDVLTNSTNK